MSEQVKIDKNLSLKERVAEFEGIQALVEEFGEVAYGAVERYYLSAGYEVGYEMILEQVREGSLTKESVRKEPVQTVLGILERFFQERGGNQPEFTVDGDTIHLTTRGSTWCPAPAAIRKVGVEHCDVCFVHKRSFAEGIATALCEFLPGLKIQVWNVESRNLPGGIDCTEAYKVIPAWHA
ncbi:MAG: hypothetical protein ACYTEZ_14510 [Planctomycetota bacterium]|jgi:hypothetical protein